MSIFTLRHRRFPVMDFDLTVTPHGFNVNAITMVYNKDLLPYALTGISKSNMPAKFEQWYERRLIPKDRAVKEPAILMMSKTPSVANLDLHGLVKIMSLISYGRCMTDKYWITPKRAFKIHTGIPNCGLDGIEIKPHYNYKGLDFFKNGIAQNFGHCVLSKEKEIKTNVDYNCPDFCTNGSIRKRIVKIGHKFWLEKFPSYNTMAEFKSFIEKAIQANQKYPEYFPKVELVVNEDHTPIGYRTPLITNEYTEIITFGDLCLSRHGYDKNPTKQKLLSACEMFGLDNKEIEKIYNAIAEYIDEKTIFTNAGILIDSDSKNIIRFAAWL